VQFNHNSLQCLPILLWHNRWPFQPTSRKQPAKSIPAIINPQVPSVPPTQSPNTSASGGGTFGGDGGVTLIILNGSAVQGNPDYDPDKLIVSAGYIIDIINQDTVPHTVTSGTGPTDPNSGQMFDSSIINTGEQVAVILGPVAAGQDDYYCMIHPYMTGKLIAQ